ncbi:hypothetical protein [Paenibacillus odorifer]
MDSNANETQGNELVAQAMKLSPVRNTIERNVKVNSTYTIIH